MTALRAAPTLRDALTKLIPMAKECAEELCAGPLSALGKAIEEAEAALAHPPEGAQPTADDAWNIVRQEARELAAGQGIGDLLSAVEGYANSRVAPYVAAIDSLKAAEGAQTEPAFVPAELENWSRSQDAAQTLPVVTMPPYWSVSVDADGENLVSIGHDWLSGSRALEQADERTILGAAQHLLSFIGYGLPPCTFDPDEGAQTLPAAGAVSQFHRGWALAKDGDPNYAANKANWGYVQFWYDKAALPTPPNAQETKT